MRIGKKVKTIQAPHRRVYKAGESVPVKIPDKKKVPQLAEAWKWDLAWRMSYLVKDETSPILLASITS